LFFSLNLSAYLFESASHFVLFFCRRSRFTSSRSRFDKFNHVKYTKTLSVRNWHATIHLLFFAAKRANAHKAISKTGFLRALRAFIGARRKARVAFFVSDVCALRATLFGRMPITFSGHHWRLSRVKKTRACARGDAPREGAPACAPAPPCAIAASRRAHHVGQHRARHRARRARPFAPCSRVKKIAHPFAMH
jgi:hypothetical protein